MSTLKVNNLQVGQDGTAANNYTLYQPASPDGTVRLGYGVAGSVTDILTLKNSRLGIGTNDPVRALDVHGGGSTDIVRFTNDSGTTLTFGSYSGMTTLDVPSSTGFRFRSGGSSGQHFTIDSSGRVLIGSSIGTKNITLKLQGHNNDSTSDAKLRLCRGNSTPTSTNQLGAIAFSDSSETPSAEIIVTRDNGTWSESSKPGALVFYTTPDTTILSEERLRIQSDGDLEYRYNDADTSTEVGATQVPHGFRILNQNNTLGRLAGITFAHGGGESANAGIFHETTNTASTSTAGLGDLVFYTKNSGVSHMSEKLRITSSGLVGIGNTNPLSGIDIIQSAARTRITQYGHLITQNTGYNTTNYWSFASRTSGEFDIGYGPPDVNGTVNSNFLRIEVTGDIKTYYNLLIPEDKKIHFEGSSSDNLNAIWKADTENTLFLTSRYNIANIIDSNNDDTAGFWSVRTNGTTLSGSTELIRVQGDGKCLPGADATQDLGSSTKRWANIYSADLQLSNEGAANEVDGTWGKYTIQEGEDDLFLINRRNGKRYKFMLQEVN